MRGLIACLLVLLAGSAAAQPVQLFDEGSMAPNQLHPAHDTWQVPAGNWRPYRAWLRKGMAPTGDPIAYLDSGVMAAHPYIKPALKTAIDLTGEGVQDEVGHGTTVALIGLLEALGGAAGGGEPFIPPIVSIKIFGHNATPVGTDLLIEGLKRAEVEGARVTNVSAGVFIGCVNARDPNGSPYLLQCEDTPLCQFIQQESERKGGGLLVVAAVGNTPGQTACPACCKAAVAVGAADDTGKPASYSGAFPDVLAPGNVRMTPTTAEP